MSAYLAIILDSFHEAFASRLLWLLLILITIALALIAPLGYRLELNTEFRQGDIRDARELAQDLQKADKDSPAGRIWLSLDKEKRMRMGQIAKDEEPRGREQFKGRSDLAKALNELLDEQPLYSEVVWKNRKLSDELEELTKQPADKLSKSNLARRNRLLIESDLKRHFRTRSKEEVQICYLGYDIFPSLPYGQHEVTQFIEVWVIPTLMSFLIGWIAIIVAVAVTAPIIPDMFQPGTLHVLLSKPLSRSLLFLSKFVGGCAFILLNVTYLIVGFWLIAGLRFGIWNHGFLKCIPIFLFLFSIYYSVSAFAGAIWRNAIVAMVVAAVFGILCFWVGFSKALVEEVFIKSQRIVKVLPVKDEIVSLNEQGETKIWNSEANEWRSIFMSSGRPNPRTLGPIYDAKGDQLLAARRHNLGFGRFMFFNPKLQYGPREQEWTVADGPDLPPATFELLAEPSGRLLAVTEMGIYRLTGNVDEKTQQSNNLLNLIPQNLRKSLPFGGGPFRDAGPNPRLSLGEPNAAAINAADGRIVVYGQGTLSTLLPDSKGQFEYGVSREIEGDQGQGAALAFGGDLILLARSEGQMQLLDAKTLNTVDTIEPEPSSRPRFLTASPDGQWLAIVFQSGNLWLMDNDSKALRRAPVTGQGSIYAATFTPDGSLLVADRGTRITRYNLSDGQHQRICVPPLSVIEIAYHYVIVPIHTVFPKPSELSNTVQYLLTDETTTDMGTARTDLQAAHAELRPWDPVWTSAIFVAVMLLVSCLYIERKEF